MLFCICVCCIRCYLFSQENKNQVIKNAEKRFFRSNNLGIFFIKFAAVEWCSIHKAPTLARYRRIVATSSKNVKKNISMVYI